MSKSKIIETERLILREFNIDDAQNVFDNYASKDNVTEFLSWQSHKSVDDTMSYLENFVVPSYENDDVFRWAIVLKSTNEVVGCIDVVKSDRSHLKAELGWVLDDNHWGKGLMPEAAKPVLQYMIEEGFKENNNVKNAPAVEEKGANDVSHKQV